jgi:GNAT superfamily N-acetyltransferase
MRPDVGIAPLQLDQVAGVVDLLGVLGYPSSVERASHRLERMDRHADYALWGASTHHGLVGIAGGQLQWRLQADDPVAELIILAVLPEAAGAGVGSALLEVFERWATERGAVRLKVTSGSHRQQAHDFYRRHGYELTGLRFHRLVRKLPQHQHAASKSGPSCEEKLASRRRDSPARG